MVQTSSASGNSLPKWFQSLKNPGQAFATTALPCVDGEIPADLSGTLYINGPARFERAGIRASHWFDGDGAILAVQFREQQAQATYQYVQTREFLEEEKAGALLYGGYGSLPAVGLWSEEQRTIKNPANTSVLVLPDRILALWEGGHPYALQPQNLNTIGVDQLLGLSEDQTYSAHPKQDPITGDIFNFGVGLGREGKLFLYRSDRTGKIQRQSEISLKGIPLIHDFVLAGPYLLFCIPPVFLRNLLMILLGLKSYSDCLQWESDQGTRILVVDRDSLEVVSQSQVNPWFQWHFGNGFINAEGDIEFTLVQYKDFATNQYLREVASGQPQTIAPSAFCQCIVNPQTGHLKINEVLVDRGCESPRVNPTLLGQRHRKSYFSVRRPTAHPTDLWQGLACFNHDNDELTETDLPVHCYPTEPVFAPNPRKPESGWILSVIYNGDRDVSEVWVFDSDRLQDEPICRLELPSVIPLGNHGTWKLE